MSRLVFDDTACPVQSDNNHRSTTTVQTIPSSIARCFNRDFSFFFLSFLLFAKFPLFSSEDTSLRRIEQVSDVTNIERGEQRGELYRSSGCSFFIEEEIRLFSLSLSVSNRKVGTNRSVNLSAALLLGPFRSWQNGCCSRVPML